MPHLPGMDFTKWPHAESGAIEALDVSRAQDLWALGGEQEDPAWPHLATQADADVASARISSAEVMEVRRTMSLIQTRQVLKRFYRPQLTKLKT
jgi:hypothetical protein